MDTGLNDQRPIAAQYSIDGTIDVHSIFRTIQGEGPFAGERALFIRLYGCNLQCPGCDTEYTSTSRTWLPIDLADHVLFDQDWARGALIVFTGGEPFRQNVVPAIYELLKLGYRVQVETNGVIAPPKIDLLDYFKNFHIVCSPKTTRISDSVFQRASAFKYVLRVGDVHARDGLPTRALEHRASPHVARPRAGAPVYVQPMDEHDGELNAANTAAAVASAMQFGYIFQLQVHKFAGLE